MANNKLILGCVLLAVALGVIGALSLSSRPGLQRGTDVTITTSGASAFGDLTALDAPTMADREQAVGSVAPTDSSKLVPAPSGGYRYSYTGAALTLSEQNVQVLQRKSVIASPTLPSSLLDGIHLAGVDLTKQGNATLQQMTLQGKDGYVLDVNLQLGTIAISQNPSKVIALTKDVSAVAETALPGDPEIIDISSRFLEGMGISKALYGDPTVDRRFLERTVQTTSPEGTVVEPAFVSPSLSVTYPLQIHGTPVLTMWGDPVGMTVVVNVSSGQVESVYGIQTQDYESSAYAGTTDWQNVLDAINKNAPAKDVEGVTTIALGAPKRVYMLMNRVLDTGEFRDLLVPALAFPVADSTTGFLAIVIPLAKDLLTSQDSFGTEPSPLPSDASTGSSSSGSSDSVVEPKG